MTKSCRGALKLCLHVQDSQFRILSRSRAPVLMCTCTFQKIETAQSSVCVLCSSLFFVRPGKLQVWDRCCMVGICDARRVGSILSVAGQLETISFMLALAFQRVVGCSRAASSKRR